VHPEAYPVVRPGQGRSGGYRVLAAYRAKARSVTNPA
jgi:hypothetical protein